MEEARSKIWLFDSRGLVVKNRPDGGVTGHKVEYAKNVAPVKVLADAIKKVKPTVLIGAAAIGGVFTKEIIQILSAYNARPVIFALSNPTSKAECTAEQAYTHSDVRFPRKKNEITVKVSLITTRVTFARRVKPYSPAARRSIRSLTSRKRIIRVKETIRIYSPE